MPRRPVGIRINRSNAATGELMTTIEDILRLSGMAPPPKENDMSLLMEQLLVASGHEPIIDAPEPALVTSAAVTSQDVNLTPLMAEPCFDIAVEFKARIQQSNGLDMVDTHTLEAIVDGLLLELCLRGIVVSYPVLGHGD